MKIKFTFLLLLFSLAALACESHLYRLSLNQRSFYNPASLCPYCKGSTFAAAGFNFMPAQNQYGYFFSLGDDGENRLHGPWDFTFGQSIMTDTSFTNYSLRYAWRQDIGAHWKLAAGLRASFVQYQSQKFQVEDDIGPEPLSYLVKKNYADMAAGLMLTNTKGFYFGLSVQHINKPALYLKDVNGNSVQLVADRNYSLMSGTVVKLSNKYDLLPDLNAMYWKNNLLAQPGCLLRYKHHASIGAGVMLCKNEAPQMDIRGGYTSSVFKWLATVSFTEDGVITETGIVYRFGVKHWRLRKISDPCTGGTCAPVQPVEPPKKREFDPHQ